MFCCHAHSLLHFIEPNSPHIIAMKTRKGPDGGGGWENSYTPASGLLVKTGQQFGIDLDANIPPSNTPESIFPSSVN